MSISYSITTNFGAKDSLASNDPDKVIKGSEFTTEFTAIQSAFALAAPAASPTFTGTATFATLNATTVDINGGAIDATTVGSTTPAAGAFTTLSASTSITGTLATAAQTNITSVGTLSALNVSGDLTVDTNTLYVDSTNNRVGVGTTSPTWPLEVSQTGTSYLSIVNEGGANIAGILFGDTANQAIGRIEYNNNVDSMTFDVNAAERMVIDSSGNVGIGTSSPSTKLAVSGDVTATNYYLGGTATNYLTGASTSLDYFNNSQHILRAQRISTDGCRLAPNQYSTGSLAAQYPAFSNLADQDTGIFFPAADTVGITVGSSEAMRIDSSGILLVGVTAGVVSASSKFAVRQSAVAPTAEFTAAASGAAQPVICYNTAASGQPKMIDFFAGSTPVVRGGVDFDYTSGLVRYNTTSDERLKENIVDAPSATPLSSIKVRSFDWKESGAHVDYGFVAQELNEVAPYAVSKGHSDDDMWSVDYSKLVPLLVKNVQELSASQDALLAELNSVKAELAKLKGV